MGTAKSSSLDQTAEASARPAPDGRFQRSHEERLEWREAILTIIGVSVAGWAFTLGIALPS